MQGELNGAQCNNKPEFAAAHAKACEGQICLFLFRYGSKPRKEIALGTDYFQALRKYAELACVTEADNGSLLFGDVIERYVIEVVPTLAPNTRHTHLSDVKHVSAFFSSAPLEQIRPMHIRQFLDRNRDKPTTANRCKRLFSTIWNHARAWGYTDSQNPCEGIKGFSLSKRTVYISNDIFDAVYAHALQPLRDAMDLAYLTGQRPADALIMTEHDIVDGHLIVTQAKTKQPLRIVITGKLAELVSRIHERKRTHLIVTAALLVNEHGKRLTAPVLRNQFVAARKAAASARPDLADEIKKFRFYD